MSKGHTDAAAGGAFLSLTINRATTLIKKMVANQSWGEGTKQQKGTHTVKETDMLAVKIDLLLSRLNKRGHEKETMNATIQATDSQMTCEVCGEVGHSGNNFPETLKTRPTSITGSDKVITAGATINPTRKEVIIISIQTSIQINLP